MENVTIVGTEEGVLVLATESGARFALAMDEVLRTELRRARAESRPAATPLAASPRDIQAHIRSGLSAAETAELLGVSVADVERFEGPVLAEREHIVAQALAVPVLIGTELEPDAQPTFGTAIRAKLEDLAALGERWVSWKEPDGWVVKLEFTANDVEHDARWTFDPRRSTLSPLNSDATQLSRQGPLPEGLIPRLRAVDGERVSPYKDDSRFDSGAFGPRLLPAAEHPEPEATAPTPAQEAAIKRAPQDAAPASDTADLLEALRRRRGQREAAPLPGDLLDPAAEPSAPREEREVSPIALFELREPPADADRALESLPGTEDEEPDTDTNDADSPARGSKRRRNAMPSWDEIVFGARSDD